MSGREVYLGGAYGPTVTGTANVLMAAVLTPGTTVIEYAACEPEVTDLARFLCAMGARIEGIGSPHLVVTGVDRLRGTRWRVIADRIEAGTFMTAAAISAIVRIEEATEPKKLALSQSSHDVAADAGARLRSTVGAARIAQRSRIATARL